MLRRLQALGTMSLVRISSGPMVVQPTADLGVGGWIPGRLAFFGADAAIGGPGFEPPTFRIAVGCFTPRPLRVL